MCRCLQVRKEHLINYPYTEINPDRYKQSLNFWFVTNFVTIVKTINDYFLYGDINH